MNLFSKKCIKICVLIVSMFWIPSNLNAQQDTTYYNSNWKETIKDSAAFFRPPVKMESDLFRIKDYYASGQLQMSGLSKTIEQTSWQGEVNWYKENGDLYQTGNYQNNKLHGNFITFLNKKRLIAVYEKGILISGAQNHDRNINSFYTEIKDDTIKDIIYEDNINGIRYENYSKLKGARLLSKYYGENGKFIGELETLDNGYVKGVEVFYYYEPMRVKQIRYYPHERFIGETVYYENGQIRTKFDLKPAYKNTYYTKDGKLLGSLTYTMDNDYLKPEHGTEYRFSYGYKDKEANLIVSVRTYENGELQKEEKRYENGTVQSISTYENNIKQLQISYNEKGEEIARMVYENYYPFTGTEISDNKQVTYLNGELIKETNFYNGTELVFSEKTQEKELYYAKDGEILGHLEIEYQNKYAKPMRGKRFYVGYDTDISSIETYEEGYLIERTVFRTKFIGENEKVDFKQTDYFEDKGYKKIREVKYYSNGSKQSDIEYKGYDKQQGKFYSDTNELIGTYNYITKNGTLYEFFDESNVIKLIQKETNGTISKLERYDYGPYRKFGDIDAVLVEEIDNTCCSKWYKKNGDIFAEATYKEGKPWEGTVYDASLRTKATIKEGKANGDYKVFDYNLESVLEEGQMVNNKKEGVVKSYNYIGQLKSTETYLNDKLHGKTTYFDDQGHETTSLIYKEGLPFEGTKIIASGYNKKPIEETYKNGLITLRVFYDENGKRISQFKDGKEAQTIAYHKDSDKKRLSYSVDKYYLNGEVVRYDENGKEQHKAIFKDNKLASGTVFLSAQNTYDNRVAYIILKRMDNILSVTMVGHKDEIIFKAEENLEQGYTGKYINKLNLYFDNLTSESLY